MFSELIVIFFWINELGFAIGKTLENQMAEPIIPKL